MSLRHNILEQWLVVKAILFSFGISGGPNLRKKNGRRSADLQLNTRDICPGLPKKLYLDSDPDVVKMINF